MDTLAESLAAAAAHRDAGRIGKARATCWQIIDVEPLHPEPWNELGLLALNAGRAMRAAYLFRHAVARDPDQPRYMRNLENALEALTKGDDDQDLYIRGYAAWRRLRDRRGGKTGGDAQGAHAPGSWGMDPPPGHGREIHVIGPLGSPAGGAQWDTLSLYRALRQHAHTTLWSESDFSPRLQAEIPVRQINHSDYPKRGTIVFVGIYFDFRPWMRVTQPRRVIFVCNTLDHRRLMLQLGAISQDRPPEIELVFGTERSKRSMGLRGTVIATLIELDRFPLKSAAQQSGVDGTFTIGRLSRDVPSKHHPNDPGLYKRLTAAGCMVRLMGGTCQAPVLADWPGIDLTPALSQSASAFLHSLDCFIYRTGLVCEAGGRVILEAMATALPVVCHRVGGYAEWIEHGENGFLFETNEEAFQILTRLKADPDLRRRVGAAARVKVETLFSQQNRQRMIDYYLR